MTAVEPRLQVAQASRILAGLSVVDAFGHVSCRHPEVPDQFYLSRSMAPALVTPGDVVAHDLSGESLAPGAPRLFLERFIHAEIYRARSDVGAIVHSHAHSVLPFTVVDVPLRPIAHTCGFLHGVERPFDVAEHRGDGTDLLISDADLGRLFARHLGDSSVALMRSHGFTAVGSTVEEAVFRAAYTATNCQIQAYALRLGDPRFLTEAEAAACDASIRSQLGRAWSLWIDTFAADLERPTGI